MTRKINFFQTINRPAESEAGVSTSKFLLRHLWRVRRVESFVSVAMSTPVMSDFTRLLPPPSPLFSWPFLAGSPFDLPHGSTSLPLLLGLSITHTGRSRLRCRTRNVRCLLPFSAATDQEVKRED